MEEESFNLSFYQNRAFKFYAWQEDEGTYTIETEDSGNWVLEGDVLTISWSSGTEDVCDFIGNTFYVPTLDATFFNGNANAGVLRKWYGTYIGELGEVFISDTMSDNAVSVSIYLNDDIGSMYSCSGMDLTPDGSTAGDEYFALHLDGNTLTIEPLTPNYENYAGTYERQ